jgi:cell division protein FtsQ
MGMKRYIKIGLIIGITVFTTFLVVLTNRYQKNKICRDVIVHFDNEQEMMFLDAENVKNILETPLILGEPYEKINLQLLENKLRKNPFIKEAELFVRSDRALQVNVKLQEVAARVFEDNGRSYYIDYEGKKIPLSPNYTARTILIRGDFNENPEYKTVQNEHIKNLLPFLKFISQHFKFSLILSELKISEDGSIEIYPELGNFVIEFGNLENYQQKLEHLWRFYKEVLPKVGWNYYERIILKYNNQILGRKKLYEDVRRK